ncbi:fe2+ zn2+ uptake regulation protein [Pseudomonas eucalypticola]|uniref:Fe2+ zn2+ uptake regulation protein n=1 Tax=Pseudomonas eucalypticola TaxID=2599595 RepID=A0A7D5D6T7_9PSED|nr:fe2+ zn2+ uptake regulation protein [Pseudomonas eucalypticola]QKZ04297.1 fe2+ zn2+ uptake regulation protein [Pseudomonas eucalypticola]
MHNSSMPSSPAHAAHSAASAPTGRGGNTQIKELLKSFGLRTSLIRLKVIDTLLSAEQQGRTVGVRTVHSHLQELDIPLSFLSVREVLKRLCSEGVIELQADKTYALSQQALAMLSPYRYS